MITLVVWSFMLALAPLTAGIACNLTASRTRPPSPVLKADGVE
jgi:hypothetical protein